MNKGEWLTNFRDNWKRAWGSIQIFIDHTKGTRLIQSLHTKQGPVNFFPVTQFFDHWSKVIRRLKKLLGSTCLYLAQERGGQESFWSEQMTHPLAHSFSGMQHKNSRFPFLVQWKQPSLSRDSNPLGVSWRSREASSIKRLRMSSKENIQTKTRYRARKTFNPCLIEVWKCTIYDPQATTVYRKFGSVVTTRQGSNNSSEWHTNSDHTCVDYNYHFLAPTADQLDCGRNRTRLMAHSGGDQLHLLHENSGM